MAAAAGGKKKIVAPLVGGGRGASLARGKKVGPAARHPGRRARGGGRPWRWGKGELPPLRINTTILSRLPLVVLLRHLSLKQSARRLPRPVRQNVPASSVSPATRKRKRDRRDWGLSEKIIEQRSGGVVRGNGDGSLSLRRNIKPPRPQWDEEEEEEAQEPLGQSRAPMRQLDDCIPALTTLPLSV